MEVPLGLVKEAGFRLATLATVSPIVRTIIYCVDAASRLRDLTLHAVMYGFEVGLVHDAATDAGLVGGDNCAVAPVVQEPQCLERARAPCPLTPVPYVLRRRRLVVEHAVAIEDHGWLAPHEGFRCRESLQRADAVIAVIARIRREPPLLSERRIDRLLEQRVLLG